MTPDHPLRLDRLAAEYVLGTMRGPARARFEKWRAQSHAVDERCIFWETRLSALASQVKPIKPPAHVWARIESQLNFAVSRSPHSARRWLGVAASLVLIAILGIVVWQKTEIYRTPAIVASIAEKSGVQHWSVEVRGAQLVVRTAALPTKPSGKDFELWALRSNGETPVSLGLMPISGDTRRTLTAAQQMALASSTQVAVSIEPAGGSPVGTPTGPVVYVAPLHSPG